MATQTGVAQRMFRALSEAGVNLLMITTSEIKISALVSRNQAATALRAVHRAFALEQAPGAAAGESASGPARAAETSDNSGEAEGKNRRSLARDGRSDDRHDRA